MTALTVYLSTTASTTTGLTTTAKELFTTNPSQINTGIATTIAKSTGYIELRSVTATTGLTAGTPTATANPVPSGNGWIWDATTLEGQLLSIGTYNVSIRVNASATTISSAFYIRLFKRSSAGVYTSVGMATIASAAMATSATTITGSFTTSAVTSFTTGDKLYLDVIAGVTVNTAGSNSSTITLQRGLTSDSVVTPGYVPPTPVITLVSANYDIPAGGKTITITGSNFTGVTGSVGVKFAATNATSYSVTNDTTISAVVPAGSRGTVDITVTHPTNGTSATGSADRFYYMDPYEAVPAGGSWRTASTWVGGVVPLASNDAYLGPNSGNVNVNSSPSAARSLDCTGYTRVFTVSASLVLGDGTAGAGNNALVLAGTFIGGSAASLRFASTSSTQQNVNFNSLDMGGLGNISFGIDAAGAAVTGGSYNISVHADPFSDVPLIHGGGTLSMATGGTYGSFTSNSGATRTLTLGSATLTLMDSSAWTASSTGLTITANTSTVTCSGNDAIFAGGDVNYDSMLLIMSGSGAATITGANTFGELQRISTAVKTDSWVLPAGATTTVTSGNGVKIHGDGGTNRLLVTSSVLGTQATISASLGGFVVFTTTAGAVDFRDIASTGSSAEWSTGTTLIGNCGGLSSQLLNAVASVSAATTVYAKMTANSSWSSAMWFTSSGGSTASRVPLPQDPVIIDANSGAFTLTTDMPRLGKDINCTGFTGTLSIASAAGASCYGSFTLSAGMTILATSSLILSGRSTHTFTSAGLTYPSLVQTSAPGGTYSLADAFVGGLMTLTNGTLNTTNFPLTLSTFASIGTATRGLTLGTSTVTLTSNGSGGPFIWNTLNTTGLTFSGASSTIVYGTASTSARTFGGGGLTFGTFTYTVAGSTGSLTISGSNTFTTINFSDTSNARSLLLTVGTTQTVTNFNVNGTATKLMSINSTTGGTSAALTKAGGGVVSSDYLSIQDIAASPSTFTWYAGTHSTNVSGNTGWIFTAPAAGSSPMRRIGKYVY